MTAADRGRSAVDLGSDLHTHSTLTDGTADPDAMADAAAAAGLHTWGLSDHVRADSDWVGDYAVRVRALRRPGLTIRCGVEAKILDAAGRLDLPSRLPRLDYVLVADHQYPGADGPVGPRDMRERLAAGRLDAAAVVAGLVEATCRAVALAPYPAIVVHPFSLLPKMGLDEDDVTDEHRTRLAEACLRADAAIEVNEKWRTPTRHTVAFLLAAGVRVVAGSDAHATTAVGAWDHALAVLGTLPPAAVTATEVGASR
ncbi:putative hydrolase [Jatrophihabitans endophyticus]|uniref:Putative hydrolase n=1 Tax=Jatrophihabitans endophyticus TaxID=1206085 RepID=A0A1M5CI72_9ACTN|nr:PHP domain-containing protein [Jatrophihabitans endophyticus]SHF54297.1 putative hydrolase [Jatrophihabitans endophyticus]